MKDKECGACGDPVDFPKALYDNGKQLIYLCPTCAKTAEINGYTLLKKIIAPGRLMTSYEDYETYEPDMLQTLNNSGGPIILIPKKQMRTISVSEISSLLDIIEVNFPTKGS